VVERIHRAERVLNVAFGIDIVENFEHHFTNILHVYVFIHYNDAFGEHGLAQRPDAAHDFACVSGVGLADGDDHQVVKDAFHRQVHVHDFGQREAHERQEDALHGLAHPGVFHGRLADDGGGINRVLAVGDARNVKDRVLIFQRIESGVVAERAFSMQFVELDVTFKNDLRRRRNFQIDGLTLDQFDRLLA
jgi:hypothetical protein